MGSFITAISIIILLIIFAVLAIAAASDEYHWSRRLVATVAASVTGIQSMLIFVFFSYNIDTGTIEFGFPRFKSPVSAPERAEEVKQTIRDFLKGGEREPPDLGLYSYLLFGSAGDSNYDSKIAAIKAYLSNFNTYKETGLIKKGKKFNGFFVFTRVDAEWIDQCDRTDFVFAVPKDPESPKVPAWTCPQKKKNYTIDELAQWIVPRLDYPRAQDLIGKLHDVGVVTDTDGIYIVSYMASVAKAERVEPAYVLIQNLSKLPPNYVGSWVQLTAQQFTKPDYWDKDTLDYAMLTIRTALAEISPGVGLTEKALGSELVKRIWPDK